MGSVRSRAAGVVPPSGGSRAPSLEHHPEQRRPVVPPPPAVIAEPGASVSRGIESGLEIGVSKRTNVQRITGNRRREIRARVKALRAQARGVGETPRDETTRLTTPDREDHAVRPRTGRAL